VKKRLPASEGEDDGSLRDRPANGERSWGRVQSRAERIVTRYQPYSR
jgi:hypothetical protein